jgi:hypothetical protein
MNSQRTITFPLVVLCLLLVAPLAHGQGRGMRGSSGGFRSGSSFRASRGGEFDRQGGRRFENNYGFPFAPFFYPDYYADSDLDYSGPGPGVSTQARMAQPYEPPAPPPSPASPLILEIHDGQWVRIPTGGEMLNAAKSPKADSGSAFNAQVVIPEAAENEPPRPALPPAVLVFRDGHSEEVRKYVIQGANLYVTAAYLTTGSWTKKIPLTDLDIPASLKVNKDRGTKFNLPSGPNEVVVRF